MICHAHYCVQDCKDSNDVPKFQCRTFRLSQNFGESLTISHIIPSMVLIRDLPQIIFKEKTILKENCLLIQNFFLLGQSRHMTWYVPNDAGTVKNAATTVWHLPHSAIILNFLEFQ